MSDIEKLRASIEALLPTECYVSRGGLRCTALIGAKFGDGGVWVEEMCCLPCRIRAALAPAPTDDVAGAQRGGEGA